MEVPAPFAALSLDFEVIAVMVWWILETGNGQTKTSWLGQKTLLHDKCPEVKRKNLMNISNLSKKLSVLSPLSFNNYTSWVKTLKIGDVSFKPNHNWNNHITNKLNYIYFWRFFLSEFSFFHIFLINQLFSWIYISMTFLFKLYFLIFF